ncbi:MAG: hypothetical protein AAF656_09775, partial [Planctomycetota bacterium]
IVVLGGLFILFLPKSWQGWAEMGTESWFPIGLFRRSGVGPLDDVWMLALSVVWKLALLLGCVGLFTRPALVVATVLGVYLLGLPHNYGKVDHYDALLIFIFAILAVSRCGDALSIDSWRKKSAEPITPSGEYRWPIRCVWIVLSMIFFSAGYAKIANGGVAWVASDSMSRMLVKEIYNADPWLHWGAWVARTPWLPNLAALATIVVEIGYPLALISRRARLFFVPAMFGAQVGIYLFMGPAFWPFLICNAFWIPWTYLMVKARRGAADSAVAGDRVVAA